MDKRENMLEKKEDSLNERQQHIEEMESKVDEMVRKQQAELERISSLTREEAKQIILEKVENELSHDIAVTVKESENRAKEEADKRAKEILSLLSSVVQPIMWLKQRYPSLTCQMMK